MDFIGVCLDPILNQAAKLPYMTSGALQCPIVFRTQTGAGPQRRAPSTRRAWRRCSRTSRACGS